MLLRWSLIGAAATILGAIAVIAVVRVSGGFSLGGSGTAAIPADEELVLERGVIRVPAARIPQGAEEERQAPSLTLLANRRIDGAPGVALAPRERDDLATVTRDFLTAWETYAPGEGGAYQRALAPLTDPEALRAVTAHRDDLNRPLGAGVCAGCVLSSRVLPTIPPDAYMRVVRADGTSAYVVTQALITYERASGGGMTQRRSYALLLHRDNTQGRWQVTRAVAETLARTENSPSN